MFTLSKQSSSSTKELHGPHWNSPFWPKTSKATVMSRFVSGYYGDDLLWSGFIDIPGGEGETGLLNSLKALGGDRAPRAAGVWVKMPERHVDSAWDGET